VPHRRIDDACDLARHKDGRGHRLSPPARAGKRMKGADTAASAPLMSLS
jgi:hypothetical protein